MKFRRLNDRVLQTEVDSGLALLDSATNTYFLLNNTGAVVWNKLEAASDLDEICAYVADQFDVTKEECQDDVQSLLDDLALKGFLVTSDERVA